MTVLRHLEPEVIADLVGWLDRNSHELATHVLACGLPLVYGFNEHQLAHAKLEDRAGAAVRVPLARRVALMRDAETATIELNGDPGWLAVAADAHLRANPTLLPGDLFFPPRNRTRSPLQGSYFRNLVGEAGRDATGYAGVSPAKLVQTRSAALIELGLELALYRSGYSDSWIMQLLTAHQQPLSLRAA